MKNHRHDRRDELGVLSCLLSDRQSRGSAPAGRCALGENPPVVIRSRGNRSAAGRGRLESRWQANGRSSTCARAGRRGFSHHLLQHDGIFLPKRSRTHRDCRCSTSRRRSAPPSTLKISGRSVFSVTKYDKWLLIFSATRLCAITASNLSRPTEDDAQETHRLIYEELSRGQFLESSAAFLRSAIQRLADRGAEGVILGCTGLSVAAGEAFRGIGDPAVRHDRASRARRPLDRARSPQLSPNCYLSRASDGWMAAVRLRCLCNFGATSPRGPAAA